MSRLAALVTLFALPALALDPRFVWETLETPHFQVHYHQGMYRYAQKAARAAELSYARLVPLLDHVPGARTNIVVQDDTDFANGNATPLLYNLIHAFAPPPDSRSTLADFDDNVYELVSHEYTHILHLDTVLGVPEAVNDVFGKLWITNGSQPLWFIEGIATFAESEVSGAGRVRSSEEEMVVRAEALAGKLPRIDRLSNLALDWPRGFGQYTVGSRFLEWIRDQYGLGALRDLSHDFGGRAIPFGMNFSSSRVLGKTYLELYDEFAAYERQRAEEVRDQVRARGETEIAPLTRLGEWVRTPRFSADGSTLYYSNAGPDRRAEIRALSRDGADRHLATLYSDGGGDDTLAVGPDGQVVFARAEVYQQFELLQDLYSVNPRTGEERRLTRGLRAHAPDVSRDGALAFVWRRPGGATAIAELRKGEEVPRVLFEDPSGEPVDSPRYSPDGSRVAFLHHREGAWDLRILDRATLAVSDVTHDRALDRNPAWTADGEWLLFSSDRTGVYDVYAARGGELRQVTDVVLGAFEPAPSPDGKQLALVTYSARGYDVGTMPLDPGSWRPVTAPPVADERPKVTALPADEAYPSHPYSPWETLRPHFWLPFAAADVYGTTVGALTAGFDAVDRHEYAATAWWSLTGKEPGWDVFYVNHSFYPDLTLELTRNLDDPQAAGGLDARGFYYETAIGGSLTATFPFSQVARTQAISLSLRAEPPLGPRQSAGRRHLAGAPRRRHRGLLLVGRAQVRAQHLQRGGTALQPGVPFLRPRAGQRLLLLAALHHRFEVLRAALRHRRRSLAPRAGAASLVRGVRRRPLQPPRFLPRRLPAGRPHRQRDQSRQCAGPHPARVRPRRLPRHRLRAGHRRISLSHLERGDRSLDPARLPAQAARRHIRRPRRRLQLRPGRLPPARGGRRRASRRGGAGMRSFPRTSASAARAASRTARSRWWIATRRWAGFSERRSRRQPGGDNLQACGARCSFSACWRPAGGPPPPTPTCRLRASSCNPCTSGRRGK